MGQAKRTGGGRGVAGQDGTAAFKVRGTKLSARLTAKELGWPIETIWSSSPSPEHRTEPYPVPQLVRIATQRTTEAAAKFTPPPYAVSVAGGGRQLLVTVEADAGWHRWSFAEFSASAAGLEVTVDLEGHTPPRQALGHMRLRLVGAAADEDRYALLARGLQAGYPAAYAAPKKKAPAWWARPIYCGWGDQVATALHLEGPGPEARALVYNTEGLYRRWVGRLEAARLNVGTVIIDAGWSPAGVWEAYPNHWPNLRGFIDDQHRAGRKVLLWIPTWLHEGLPDEWCVRAGGRALVADATNLQYLAFLRRQTARLLSDAKDGYNADGFKIDQLAYVPTEVLTRGGEQFGRSFYLPPRHPRLRQRGSTWGCESLYRLQRAIYEAAKAVKPDALVNSSTIHPYFHDTCDMARLHDTESVAADIFAGMKARADLSRAALPHKLVDADDWVHHDYRKWLDYTRRSRHIGVPCLFYTERFVLAFDRTPTTRPIPLAALKGLARAWAGL